LEKILLNRWYLTGNLNKDISDIKLFRFKNSRLKYKKIEITIKLGGYYVQ